MTLNQFEESYAKVVSHFTAGVYADELLSAQKDFFNNTGTLDENKANYTLRMRQFFDWYFLTRKLSSHMQTPLFVAMDQRSLRLSDADQASLIVLSKHKHSLYEFLKLKKDTVFLKDLLTLKKIEVSAEGQLFNFDPKETFEARIIQIDQKNYFLKGFCFHPESALKYILEQLKNIRANPDLDIKEFLLRLNKMRYKLEQYRHIKPEMVYTNENKLNL
jgi:hypothetical protein